MSEGFPRSCKDIPALDMESLSSPAAQRRRCRLALRASDASSELLQILPGGSAFPDCKDSGHTHLSAYAPTCSYTHHHHHQLLAAGLQPQLSSPDGPLTSLTTAAHHRQASAASHPPCLLTFAFNPLSLHTTL
ncbi:hypothetical protein F7725_011545 [Dissostichus mawsoni]|uniref:Uncharacterized protein n=1 Tax=Dissostichus mawsoni TaxID=36200 RepID=A0A7J5Z970_DISMA|nr:hypothetical protein F7725_011545 [Dissostichus mawsoni]